MSESLSFRPTPWQFARIERIEPRTARIRSYFLRVSMPLRYLAGQHVDVRLTAEDGYTAERSYSIASAPSDESLIELAIERLDDGEISTWFHDVAEVGDAVELRGPVGWSFAWMPKADEPVLLLGGGSGVVPLLSMMRTQRQHAAVPMALLYSVRSWEEAAFADELLALEATAPNLRVRLTLTRDAPRRTGDHGRRIDAAMVAALLAEWGHVPAITFICGSNAFVNAASDAAIATGMPAARIRTERFGG
jgi:ferredoxin-NADP reductase